MILQILSDAFERVLRAYARLLQLQRVAYAADLKQLRRIN